MGDLSLESVEEVKRYQSVFERNQAVALVPEESSAFLSALARELSRLGASRGVGPATADVTTTAWRSGRPARVSPSVTLRTRTATRWPLPRTRGRHSR